MEQSQLETIETICRNIQLMASDFTGTCKRQSNRLRLIRSLEIIG